MRPAPDAELLALAPTLRAAVEECDRTETATTIPPGVPDADFGAWVTRTGQLLLDVCWEIINAPPARTEAGRALKAAAAMHQLRFAFSGGAWDGAGEEMAWLVLSELARNAYVPAAVPEYLRARCEPEMA